MQRYDRREWMRQLAWTGLAASASGWLPQLARAAARSSNRRRQCILLWMTGGPSQLDTFDMKPGHENGGPFSEIATRAPGIRWSEHLPKLAESAEHLAIIRSVSTKEGDHGRGTYLMRTGRPPGGPVRYPSIGALLAKELGEGGAALPDFVSIAPYRVFNAEAYGPGFLGPRYAPLTVAAADAFQPAPPAAEEGYAELRVDDLPAAASLNSHQTEARRRLWSGLQDDFLARYPHGAGAAQHTVYERAMRLVESEAARAFDLSQESEKTREAYGRGRFGQGCLMARRLIERGVPFVEVSLGAFGGGSLGWDTHRDNFNAVRQLSAELDSGWSALLRDLAERGLLETTTILWMGEFGRTPKINAGAGRDHYPAAWSCALAGGGIQGGALYGRTSADGLLVEDSPVDAPQVLATLCAALGIDPSRQNISEQGRPFRLAEAKPIEPLLTEVPPAE